MPATTRSLAALRGKPAVVLLLVDRRSRRRARRSRRSAAAQQALTQAGVGSLAIALDTPGDRLRAAARRQARCRSSSRREVGLSYAILNRHLFMNRQDLRLPTSLLLDAGGNVVKAYRDAWTSHRSCRTRRASRRSPAERLDASPAVSRTFYSGAAAPQLPALRAGAAGSGPGGAAVVAFERAAQANPSASTLYRLGTLLPKSGETARARAAFERALALQPDLAEASNDLGALLAQGGDLDAAIARFRAALASTPDYPDALNNLGYALLLTGHDEEARALYEKALALQPDFPEALNNLGLLFGRAGDLDRAERYFRDALAGAPTTARRRTTWRWSSSRAGRRTRRSGCSKAF